MDNNTEFKWLQKLVKMHYTVHKGCSNAYNGITSIESDVRIQSSGDVDSSTTKSKMCIIYASEAVENFV